MEDAPRAPVLIASSSSFLRQAIANGLKDRHQVALVSKERAEIKTVIFRMAGLYEECRTAFIAQEIIAVFTLLGICRGEPVAAPGGRR